MDIAVNIASAATGYSTWMTWLSRISPTSGSTANVVARGGSFTNVATPGPRKRSYQPHIADTNGDGLADMLAFDGNPEMWQSNGVAPDYGITPYLGMFRWHGCLSRGNGTFDCSVWRGPPSGEFDFAGRKFPLEVLGDFNGDGRTDVAIYDPDYSADHPGEAGRWWLCVARPNPPGSAERGAFDCGPTLTGSQLQGGGIYTNGLRRKGRTQTNPNKYEFDIVVAGDFNGDGRTGLAGGTYDRAFPRITRLNVPDSVASIPDMLASVANGLGFTNSFKYKPITDNTIYTKYNTSTTYPKLDIQTAMYVATEASHDDGIGGTKTYTYKYEGLTGHVTGGGSLGFAKVIVTDGQSGIVTATEYDNTYPARGLVKQTTKTNIDNKLLNRSTSTYRKVDKVYAAADTDVRSKIHAYLPEKATEKSWELTSGMELPRTETETKYVGTGAFEAKYGCATQVDARTFAPGVPSTGTPQFSKSVTNVYANSDTTYWRLCRLTEATVVSTQNIYPLGQPVPSSETRNSTFAYDAGTGLLVNENVQPTGAPEVRLFTEYEHDNFGNRRKVKVTGRNGNADETRISRTGYDTRGRFPTESIREVDLPNSASTLELVENRTYSPTLGVQLTSTFDGVTTTAKYDKLGRKVTERRDDTNNPAGIKTAMSYTASPYGGVTITSKVTGGGQSSADSDRLGREVRKSVYIADNGSLRWSRVNTVYDARGRVDKVSRPYFDGNAANYPCSREYDNIDRVKSETCANDTGAATTTSTVFNGLSTTLTVSAPDTTGTIVTRTSTTLLDARGMTQKVTNTQGSTVEHAYDAAGNLVSTKRSANTGGTMITALTYDIRGRKKTLSDPDTGDYGYTYNAFGELLKQTDGKNQPTDSLYDKLGRVTQRSSNGELISNYTYDICTKGLGKLCSVTAKGSASPSGTAATVGHSRTLTYDSVGRFSGETTATTTPSTSSSAFVTKTYTASTDFDLSGRVNTINYPNGQFVTRLYDEVGAWKQLLGSNGQPLWTGGNADAEAHWTNWTLGNGRRTDAAFGGNTGRLATLATDRGAQNLALTYDGFGNIQTRLDAPNGYCQSCTNNPLSTNAETFTYDTLNQLKTANFLEGNQTLTYDGFGRIVTKSGVNGFAGTYDYYTTVGSTSNRLQTANARSYTYDGNGNADTITGTAVGSITLSWTAFNQPLTLPVAAAQNASVSATGNANAVITLKYGSDNQRVFERLPRDDSVTGANQTAQRYVLHSGASLFYEEDVRNDGSIEQRAYLTGPLGVVAVHTTNTDGIPTATFPLGTPVTPTGQQLNAQNNNGTPYTLTYWHRDHLGSLTVTTDDTGAVKERMRFDPWGKPMTPLGSKAKTGDRGFTGHEHLAGGLIHMNGRIYDPVLGRFLSADIVVQFPSAITSYNRYAYVMNNPLAFTDPSGYFIVELFAIISTFLAANAGTIALTALAASGVAAATGHLTAARRFLGVALAFGGMYIGGVAGNVALGTFAGAFAAGGLQSGSLEGAILAGVTVLAAMALSPLIAEALTGLDSVLNSAFGTQTFTTMMSGSIAGCAACGVQIIERVEVTGRLVVGNDGLMYSVTTGSFGAAAALANGATRTEGVSISARRYSPAVNEMLEFMKWGTPFGGLLSCASSYEECSGVGWGFAVAGIAPIGAGKGLVIGIAETRAAKIFGSRAGHLADSPANRELLSALATDSKALLGTSSNNGHQWAAKTLGDGSQLWVEVRNGQVWNGGINAVPRTFNSTTGLASQTRPGWK